MYADENERGFPYFYLTLRIVISFISQLNSKSKCALGFCFIVLRVLWDHLVVGLSYLSPIDFSLVLISHKAIILN